MHELNTQITVARGLASTEAAVTSYSGRAISALTFEWDLSQIHYRDFALRNREAFRVLVAGVAIDLDTVYVVVHWCFGG
jgi:hypothetical protein